MNIDIGGNKLMIRNDLISSRVDGEDNYLVEEGKTRRGKQRCEKKEIGRD